MCWYEEPTRSLNYTNLGLLVRLPDGTTGVVSRIVHEGSSVWLELTEVNGGGGRSLLILQPDSWLEVASPEPEPQPWEAEPRPEPELSDDEA